MDFKYVDGKPELISIYAVEGKLKRNRTLPRIYEGIIFSTLSAGDSILYQNAAENPSESIYEYPGENGSIGRTVVKHDSISFTLRVPYSTAAEKIRLELPIKNKSALKTAAASNTNSFEFFIDHSKISNRK
jgi:hypothetical protein